MSLTEFSILKGLAVFVVLCLLELTLKFERKNLDFDKAATLGSKLG